VNFLALPLFPLILRQSLTPACQPAQIYEVIPSSKGIHEAGHLLLPLQLAPRLRLNGPRSITKYVPTHKPSGYHTAMLLISLTVR
jgi:hypothetical protein